MRKTAGKRKTAARRTITHKQQRFVDEYLIDLNATQAAIRAGYSPKTAQVQSSRLLSNAMVSAAIEAATQERAARTKIDQDWVIERLVENAERALQRKPVLGGDGEPAGEYRYDGAVANRALELLGKHEGMFTDRLQLTDTTEGRIIALLRQIDHDQPETDPAKQDETEAVPTPVPVPPLGDDEEGATRH